MPLIVNGVCRFTLQGQMGPRPWAIIHDIRIDTTGEVTAREDAINNQAEVIWDQVFADLRGAFVNSWQVQRVSWVDLDEPDGSVGFISGTSTNPAAYAGAVATPGLSPQVCALVNKQIPSRRGQRNGRMYWNGIPESVTDAAAPGFLVAGTVTAMQTAFTNYLGNLNQDGGSPSYQSRLCVVHVTERDGDGNPTAGISRDVEALSLQPALATQRRRQRK